MVASIASQCLVQPPRIASLMKWNSSEALMALNISQSCIDLAIAKSPTLKKIYASPPNYESFKIDLPLGRMKGSKDNVNSREKRKEAFKKIAKEIQAIADEKKVCGSIVYLPISLQGKMGEGVGHTMYVLDEIANASKAICKSRPYAFVNYTRKVDIGDFEDAFGRIANYARKKDLPNSDFYSSKDAWNTQQALDTDSKNSAEAMLKKFTNEHLEKEKPKTSMSSWYDEHAFDEYCLEEKMYIM